MTTCKTCPYFSPHSTASASASSRGECRRSAPKPYNDNESRWPITYGDDWCGEHPERAKAAGQAPYKACRSCIGLGMHLDSMTFCAACNGTGRVKA